MAIESSPFLKMSLLTFSRTSKLFPSYLPAQLSPSRASATAKASSFGSNFRSRAGDLLSISLLGNFQRISSLTMRSPSILPRVRSSAALTSSGGGGGDGLPGGAGGGGGDGGSSGREVEARSLAWETLDDPALGPDVIFLRVGGMTCGGCAASVKRILESRPQVASATVQLEKEIAVVWPLPETMDGENWQQHLGEKLANHLTNCGFKSNFQGQRQAFEQEF